MASRRITRHISRSFRDSFPSIYRFLEPCLDPFPVDPLLTEDDDRSGKMSILVGSLADLSSDIAAACDDSPSLSLLANVFGMSYRNFRNSYFSNEVWMSLEI